MFLIIWIKIFFIQAYNDRICIYRKIKLAHRVIFNNNILTVIFLQAFKFKKYRDFSNYGKIETFYAGSGHCYK